MWPQLFYGFKELVILIAICSMGPRCEGSMPFRMANRLATLCTCVAALAAAAASADVMPPVCQPACNVPLPAHHSCTTSAPASAPCQRVYGHQAICLWQRTRCAAQISPSSQRTYNPTLYVRAIYFCRLCVYSWLSVERWSIAIVGENERNTERTNFIVATKTSFALQPSLSCFYAMYEVAVLGECINTVNTVEKRKVSIRYI